MKGPLPRSPAEEARFPWGRIRELSRQVITYPSIDGIALSLAKAVTRAADDFELFDVPLHPNGRRGHWSRVRSGGRFYPHDARPEDIQLEDIWWALGFICRYGGHCDRFYSVLTHSLMVASMVAEPELNGGRTGAELNLLIREALLHDGTEAYVGDVIRPLKKFLPGYRLIETGVAVAIGGRVGLGDRLARLDPAVHIADNLALAVEIRDLFGDPQDWTIPYADEYPALIARYRCVDETWDTARERARALWAVTAQAA